MKNIVLLFAALCLSLSSCSYNQFGAAATGSSLGGVFGSSIGGLMGGYRGHQLGTAIGMTAGAAVGLAATAEKRATPREDETDRCNVEYDEYESNYYEAPQAPHNGFNALEVERVRFADANNNRYLEAGERASIELEIYNYGDGPLYNIAPQITCDNRRIMISPSAIVEKLEPGQGFRYRAEVSANNKLKDGKTTFQIAFGNNGKKCVKKSFSIRTRR